jgi:acyl dehydratase
MRMAIRFDDIDGFNALASTEWGEWGPELEVTQDMINAFAELTGDHQWIHVDVERAKKESPFGGPIAHGLLTLALLPRWRPSMVDVEGHGSAANYGAGSIRFAAPVPAGAKVHARSRLIGAEPKSAGTLVTTEFALHVVGNEKPSLLYNMMILYMPKR